MIFSLCISLDINVAFNNGTDVALPKYDSFVFYFRLLKFALSLKSLFDFIL